MALDRTTIISGPGTVTTGAAAFHTADDINVELLTEFFDVENSALGPVDRRVSDRRVVLRFTPTEWVDLATLLPYATTLPGSDVFGGTDTPWTVNPLQTANSGHVIGNCAVTRMPNLSFRTEVPVLGECEVTGLVANNGDPSDPADFVAATSSTGDMTAFGLSDVKTEAWTATLTGINGGSAFHSENGFEVEWELQLEPIKPDGCGTVGMRMVSLSATARFVPVEMTTAEMRTALAAGSAGIGGSPTANNLVITGGGITFTLASCQLASSNSRYGQQSYRAGEVVLQARRTVSAGALAALWTIA